MVVSLGHNTICSVTGPFKRWDGAPPRPLLHRLHACCIDAAPAPPTLAAPLAASFPRTVHRTKNALITEDRSLSNSMCYRVYLEIDHLAVAREGNAESSQRHQQQSTRGGRNSGAA
jgi:hypothetical protein